MVITAQPLEKSLESLVNSVKPSGLDGSSFCRDIEHALFMRRPSVLPCVFILVVKPGRASMEDHVDDVREG